MDHSCSNQLLNIPLLRTEKVRPKSVSPPLLSNDDLSLKNERDNSSQVIKGQVRVGPMRGSRDKFESLKDTHLEELLTRECALDTIIEAVNAEFSVVDADTHHWPKAPSDEELFAYMNEVYPLPEASWISHGKGLKFVFIGKHHEDRALAAAFSLPSSFSVELLKHTRHPRSARSDKPGTKCGQIIFNCTVPDGPFEFRNVGRLTPEKRDEALSKLQMELGQRYHHSFCPIDPDHGNANDCVVALDEGIFCFRCSGNGKAFKDGMKPGFYPYSVTALSDLTTLESLAKHRVHWTHAVYELKYRQPNLAEGLLRRAYEKTLTAVYKADDPRVAQVFNPHLSFVRGEGIWLSSSTLKLTTVDNDAASALPYVQYIKTVKDVARAAPDTARRSEVKFRDPQGYTPLRPFKGIRFDQAQAGVIPVRVGPKPKFEIKLLSDPMPKSDALAVIAEAFPLVEPAYLQAILAAAVCAEVGRGQPPMLCASGPSGSGKGETIRLAASFLSEDAVKVQLCDDPDAFMRSIGALLAAGSRFFVFDEFSKIRNLSAKISSILQLGSTVSWRPLFHNSLVTTPCRAAFFFPCVSFNESLTTSPEFTRRVRHVRLYRKTPNWSCTSGGDTAAWRDRSERNAYAANSILTHTWRLCDEKSFRFF
jgi:hypothetical protein